MSRARIAVFSPLKPVPSGISDYCEEFLRLLTDEYEFTLYLDGYEPVSDWLKATFRHYDVCEYEENVRQDPYDLTMYHLGNAPWHNYMMQHLFSHPGLLVLHDGWLMGTRLAKAVKNWEGDQLRAEMVASYGEAGGSAAEIILAGLHNQNFLRYYPMIELPVRSSLMTVVHSGWLARSIENRLDGISVQTVPLRLPFKELEPQRAAEVRRRFGFRESDFVIGCFGLLTPQKRIAELLEAVAWLRKRIPHARCLLAGGQGNDLPLADIIQRNRLDEDAVVSTGRVSDDDFLHLIAGSDVVTALRWPTMRESSGIVITAMYYSRAVIVSDLAHMNDFPEESLVRIPLVEEQRAMREALLDLAQCPPLRNRIGNIAGEYVRTHHSEITVRDRWREIIAGAMDSAMESMPEHSFLPDHLRLV
jgi:glycosyltransferase involved in cell wall biosynthesis